MGRDPQITRHHGAASTSGLSQWPARATAAPTASFGKGAKKEGKLLTAKRGCGISANPAEASSPPRKHFGPKKSPIGLFLGCQFADKLLGRGRFSSADHVLAEGKV